MHVGLDNHKQDSVVYLIDSYGFHEFLADVGGFAAALIFLFYPLGAYFSESTFKQEFINKQFLVKQKKERKQ